MHTLTTQETEFCLQAITTHNEHNDNAHDDAHLMRVWSHVQTLIKAENVKLNTRLLHACTLLHDLINLPKSHPESHTASRQSGEAAKPILERLGFDEVDQQHGQHIISAHSYSAQIPPATCEAKILQDADRLDALGHIGLARWISISGQLGQIFFHPTDPFANKRPLEHKHIMLDHFFHKIIKLPKGFQTPSGRTLAEDKLQTMIAWIDAFGLETQNPHWKPGMFQEAVTRHQKHKGINS